MRRSLVLIVPFALSACGEPRPPSQPPVLEFPEPGVDDPAAYEGYATRLFRDSRDNAFQVYLDQRAGRVVDVWADAANESAAFTVRDPEGEPLAPAWGGPGARVDSSGGMRSVGYRLAVDAPALELGHFLLGTMRQERDFQYAERHLRPLSDPPFVLPELTGLVASLERLPEGERGRHLALLGARDVEELRGRLEPRVSLSADEATWTLLVEHTSLDAKHHMSLALAGDAGTSMATLEGGRAVVRARADGPIELDVTVSTDADPLTALGRERLFNPEFEAFYAARARAADSLRRTLSAEEAARDPRMTAFRRLERQTLALELLSSGEKLMASLPNYATYFGRDQMMSALMLEPISSIDLQELVIASVLRKVDPAGNVSHEEALGGQAIRENAAAYTALVRAWEEDRERDPDTGEEDLARARDRLSGLDAVRENYRMVDDDLQLSVLVARYLGRPDVPAERKRRFLQRPADEGATAEEDAKASGGGSGPTRRDALVRNLGLVAELTRAYARRPAPTDLVSFYHRDDRGWLPGSWRDSRAGYGNGRFAMDVNAVWAPAALAGLERIVAALDTLGLPAREASAAREGSAAALLGYLDEPEALRHAIETWRAARRHFEVRLEPAEIRRRVDAKLAELPAEEGDYWRKRLARVRGSRSAAGGVPAARPLVFLALSLDEEGRPIAAPNTDPATALFLGDDTAGILAGVQDPSSTLDMLDVIGRPYPVGLFIDGLGPVVVNDAYASADVRQRFAEDAYHSPRVVWGREVNLLLLGLARQIGAAYDSAGRPRSGREDVRDYVDGLRDLLDRTRAAVEASGLGHNELWSYRIEGDTLRPVRYGQSSDIQLWNVTDLAVEFLLDRLPPR